MSVIAILQGPSHVHTAMTLSKHRISQPCYQPKKQMLLASHTYSPKSVIHLLSDVHHQPTLIDPDPVLGVLLLLPLLLGLVVLDPDDVPLDGGLLDPLEVLGVVVVVVPVPVSLVTPSAVVTLPPEEEVPDEEVGPPTLPELKELVP